MKRAVKWLFLILGAVMLVSMSYVAFDIYRVVYRRQIYETVPPELPGHLTDTAILIFSKTNGFRKDAAVKASNVALTAIAQRRSWSAVFTENGAVFNPAMLSRFKATVWNNTSGDVPTTEQKASFRAYIENAAASWASMALVARNSRGIR